MGKLSTFITRLKQTLTKIGEDVADLRENKADVSDLDNCLPIAGGTMNTNALINFNYQGGLAHAGQVRLRFATGSNIFSTNNSGSGIAFYFRPQGDLITTGQVTIDGNGQINTQNHGNSSQWKQAYDWGNHINKYVGGTTNPLADPGTYSGAHSDLPLGSWVGILSTSASGFPSQATGGIFSFGRTATNITSRIFGSRSNVDGLWYSNGDPSTATIYQVASREWVGTQGYLTEVSWGDVSGKPTSFPPSAHTHSASDIDSGVFSTARIPSLPISKITNLQGELDNKANTDGSNTIGGEWKIDKIGSDLIGLYLQTDYFDNDSINIPLSNALPEWKGVELGAESVPVVFAEDKINNYIYRTGLPRNGYPANQQNGNYLIESKHRFRLHEISAPDSTSGGEGFLTVQPFNAIEHSYFRVTISGVELLAIDMKAPTFDEITGFAIERNAIGQKCTVAVSGSMVGVKFTGVSGADFSSEWNKGVFTFYWTGTGWMFGGYSPIVP